MSTAGKDQGGAPTPLAGGILAGLLEAVTFDTFEGKTEGLMEIW